MTAEPGRWTAQALATVLTLSGIVACSPQQTTATPESREISAESLEPTTFTCKPYQGSWGTFAERGNAVSKYPMITWNTREFGDRYTPEERCGLVSKRFTEAVASNGGKLSDLDLTTGILNDYPVVCFVTDRSSSCSDRNLLFTLKKENGKNPRQVLTSLTNFGQGQAGPDSKVDERGKKFPQFIRLEPLVNNILPKDGGW